MEPIEFFENMPHVNLDIPLLSPPEIQEEYEIPFEFLALDHEVHGHYEEREHYEEHEHYGEHYKEHNGETNGERFYNYEMRNGESEKPKRRTISSLDKVRTWKKYAKNKHLTQTELDRKRDLANKQERRRMHRLNTALDRLRDKIQKCDFITSHSQHPPRRLSKIKTLKLAIDYIHKLQEMLQS